MMIKPTRYRGLTHLNLPAGLPLTLEVYNPAKGRLILADASLGRPKSGLPGPLAAD